jgi:TetR/AcrR family transcriptional repressor of nem operon
VKNQLVGYLRKMESRKDRNRQRILEAAAEAFWRKSFHSVNVNQICVRAQVNKATLYQHFSAKEVLAVAVIDYQFDRQKAEVYEAAVAASPGPIDRLGGIYQRVYQQHLNRYDRGEPCSGCPFVNLATEMASESPAIRDAVKSVFERFKAYYLLIARDAKVVGYATRDLDGDATSSALVTIMNGAMVSAKTENRPDAILESLNAAKLILRG